MPTTLALVLAVALTACSHNNSVLPHPLLMARLHHAKSDQKTPHDVVMLDASTAATAHVGDLLQVKVKMNAGTGYEWRCVPTAGAAAVVEAKFDLAKGTGKEQPLESGRVGGPVECIFEFAVTGPGTATLTFDLARAWEAGQASSDRRTLTLTVSAAPKN